MCNTSSPTLNKPLLLHVKWSEQIWIMWLSYGVPGVVRPTPMTKHMRLPRLGLGMVNQTFPQQHLTLGIQCNPKLKTLETKKFLHLQRNTSQALVHRSRYPDKNSKQANYPFFIWEVLLAKIGAAKSINCELRGIIRPNDQIHTAAPKGSY